MVNIVWDSLSFIFALVAAVIRAVVQGFDGEAVEEKLCLRVDLNKRNWLKAGLEEPLVDRETLCMCKTKQTSTEKMKMNKKWHAEFESNGV